MSRDELKEALTAKRVELETAMEAGRSRAELMDLYKELKALQFEQVHAGLTEES